MKTFESLFLDELADMYDAEHRLVKALPKMARAATHDGLKAAFLAHLAETEGHVEKLEQVFKSFNKEAKPQKCEATVGLLKEADEIAEDNQDSPTINAALISAAQKVEHYEIASYGTLRTWSEQLGNSKATKLLAQILEQEKGADEALTVLAVTMCNASAEGAPEDEDGEEASMPEGTGRKSVAKGTKPAVKARPSVSAG